VSLLMIAPTFVCNIETGLSMGGNTMNPIISNISLFRILIICLIDIEPAACM